MGGGGAGQGGPLGMTPDMQNLQPFLQSQLARVSAPLGPAAQISPPPGNPFNVPADISQQSQSLDFAPLIQAARAVQPGPGAQVSPPPGNPFNVPTDISQQKQSIDFAPLFQAARAMPPGLQGFQNSLGTLGGIFGLPSVAPNYNQPIPTLTNNPVPPPAAPTPPPAPWAPPMSAPAPASASAPAPSTPPGVDQGELAKLTPAQLNVFNTLIAGGVPAFMALLSAQAPDAITGSGA